MDSSPKYIVVIGTSAGGASALEELIMQFKPEMDAAFFVVLHLSRKGIGDYLFHRFQKYTSLKVRVAQDGDKIEKSVIYIAPPDNHMLLTEGQVSIGRGAPENGWRPSINNLFRSAAAAYNSRVIAIILTGMLDDGTSGMSAIVRSGGTAIVQDPNEAEYPDMPLSVLNNMEVEFCISLSKMGGVLSEIISGPAPEPVQPPADVLKETELDLRVAARIEEFKELEKIDINCPDCGGGLYITQREHPAHFRCHVGHSFTERELLIRLSEVMESTFWTSLRMMEEKRSLLMRLHDKDVERGFVTGAKLYKQRAEDLEVHIENLKQILFTSTNGFQ
jgi:two-component system, chemotaxis family, protein-glutamate methylesterase/glutaminase